MEYRMVIADRGSFQHQICLLLADGWVLHGQAFPMDNNICQAMIKKEKKKRGPNFKPPTEQQVVAFSLEKGYNLKGFFDFYESKGWKVGNNTMKNWQAAARNWNARNKSETPTAQVPMWKEEKHTGKKLTREEIQKLRSKK